MVVVAECREGREPPLDLLDRHVQPRKLLRCIMVMER
jgi:hypothetical protein